MSKLINKVAVVTGGSSGIGLATAQRSITLLKTNGNWKIMNKVFHLHS